MTSISSFSGALYARAVDAKRHKNQLRTFMVDVALVCAVTDAAENPIMIPIITPQHHDHAFHVERSLRTRILEYLVSSKSFISPNFVPIKATIFLASRSLSISTYK